MNIVPMLDPLALIFLALVSLASSQEFSSQFVTYEQQCGYEVTPHSRHPHVLYDNGYRRPHNGKVADGLGLLQKIAENATEAGAPYIPDLRQMKITRDDLRKLIKVVQLPYLISNRPLQERIGFEIPTAGLDTVATDMCKLLQRHLVGVYKAFNCIEEELRELDARLVYSDLLEQHYATLTSTVPSPPAWQCQYWNSRGLDGCVVGNTLTRQEFEVHEQVVTPLYEQLCRCDQDPYSPLCTVQTS